MEDVTIDLSTEDEAVKPAKSKKKKSFILPITLLAIIALLVTVIKLDIGKITSKYIAPKIENIPIVKNILPKAKEKDLYASHSKKQLANIINTNEQELEIADQEIERQVALISDLQAKIEELEVFEKEYLTFREEKRMFDEQVATMDKEEFVKYYEEVHPENAQQTYAQIVQEQQLTKEQRQYSSLISEMDETSAAKLLENLFETDMDIILSLLSNMDTESASAILDEMDSKIASTVVKQLSPQ